MEMMLVRNQKQFVQRHKCPRINNTRGKSDLVDHYQHTREYLFPVSMNVPVTDGLDVGPS